MIPAFFATCPLCDGGDATPFVSKDELVFSTCKHCRLVFKSHALTGHRDVDWYQTEQASTHKGKSNERFRHRVNKAKRQIRAAMAFTRVQRMLDVGCGYGYAVQAGRELGLQASGVDVSEAAVNQCRAQGLDAQVATLERIDLAAQSFDLVLMKHVFEHANEPRAALAEAHRLLRPGGVVVIAVPDLGYWRLTHHPERRRAFDPRRTGREHHVYYTEDTLAQMLERHGFAVQARSKVIALPASGWQRLLEPLRFASVWLWQTAARTLHLRRELFFVARKRESL